MPSISLQKPLTAGTLQSLGSVVATSAGQIRPTLQLEFGEMGQQAIDNSHGAFKLETLQ